MATAAPYRGGGCVELTGGCRQSTWPGEGLLEQEMEPGGVSFGGVVVVAVAITIEC